MVLFRTIDRSVTRERLISEPEVRPYLNLSQEVRSMKRRLSVQLIAGALALTLAACHDAGTAPDEGSLTDAPAPSFARSRGNQDISSALKEMMASVNDALAERGEKVRVSYVEWIAAPGAQHAGQTVYFDHRSKQMGSHWVPFDPWRWGSRDIYWLSDQVDGAATGVSAAATQAAVGRAMATWASVDCSNLPLVQWPDFGLDWGYTQYLTGFGGIPGWYADYTHAGWLPGDFFEFIGGPGASDEILGVTYTYIWVWTATGEPTDVDNNRKEDVAFRETYYNNKFSWGVNTGEPIDIETIVLHEAGHGLSQGHFGKAFRTTRNGKLHIAPRALMNAAYSGVQQDITGTDNGGHCSIWGSWPNN